MLFKAGYSFYMIFASPVNLIVVCINNMGWLLVVLLGASIRYSILREYIIAVGDKEVFRLVKCLNINTISGKQSTSSHMTDSGKTITRTHLMRSVTVP